MDITAQRPDASSSPTPSTATPAGANAPSSALSSDFETFLRMLTVQMENQDPLNPIESSDFAVQLATFSGVEQQVRTNDLLAQLGAGLTGDLLSQYAGWVGLSAASSAPVYFDGSPISMELAPAPNSDSALLEVRDQSGRVVESRAVTGQAGAYDWAGIGADGQQFLTGQYTFSLKSYSGEDLIAEAPVQVYQTVSEARLGDEGVEIVFAGGGSTPAGEISALRQP